MGMLETVGSVCSGIEAASVAWTPLGLQFQWVSEIDEFPSRVLRTHYPKMPNVGDMRKIPDLLRYGQLFAPDIICGGTPCQAFSLAGQQNGLQDERGNLSLRFAEIVDANDVRRLAEGKGPTVVFWENVEGVLSDHTNAFGYLLSALTGSDLSRQTKWYHAGYVRGAKRNVAWRVLDAKYFGIPQQRNGCICWQAGGTFPRKTSCLNVMNTRSRYIRSNPTPSSKPVAVSRCSGRTPIVCMPHTEQNGTGTPRHTTALCSRCRTDVCVVCPPMRLSV